MSSYDPATLSVVGKKQASVALILREIDEATEVLFIERAHREGDPWSGHMAFPGGRMDPEDRHSRDVAERETEEEVGISLQSATYLGRLDDLQGRPESRSGELVISSYVYHLEKPAPVVLSDEVEAAFWFPLNDLHEEQRRVEYPYSEVANLKLPGILVGEPNRHIVWGLTYRFLEVFFNAVERPLPRRWEGF